MPKISVVIPIYNAELYLKKCLESIINQSFQDFEIIAINDGSTDGSQEIIDHYLSLYPSLMRSYMKKNGGQASARNFGMEQARGEYVIFIDSDDYIEKEMLEILYSASVEHDSDLIICDYNEVDVETNKVSIKKAIERYSDDMKINYMLSNPSPWNKLIKLSCFKQNNIKFLEGHIYEDLATMPLLTQYAKNITYVEKPLYDYILHPNSTMRQNIYNKKLESIFYVMEYLEEEFKKRNLYDRYLQEVEFLHIEHLLYAASGRFLQYVKGRNNLSTIKNIIKLKYPMWKKNRYYQHKSFQFRMSCTMFYMNNNAVLKLYNKMRKIQEI